MTYPEYIERLEDVLRRKPTSDTSHRDWITEYWELMLEASSSRIFDDKDSWDLATPKEITAFWETYRAVRTQYDKMKAKIS